MLSTFAIGCGGITNIIFDLGDVLARDVDEGEAVGRWHGVEMEQELMV